MPFSRQRIDELIAVYRDGLLQDTVPFWLQYGVDHEFGGVLTALDRDGSVLDMDKGVWQQGRFAWLMGELYNNVEARDEWLRPALDTAEFMETHCRDPEDGRLWFHVTREGLPIRKRRYAFSERFAAIALDELARATGQDRYRDRARSFFQAFLERGLNPKPADQKFTSSRPTTEIGFPMITIATTQELRGSVGLEEADEWIDRSIERIRALHMKPEIECVMETVGPDGRILDHFDGRTLIPGHAIEGAWFIMSEGQHRHDRTLIDVGCQMLDWMWHRGWDTEYGGLLYFLDVDGHPVQEYWHDMKFWWPHNETIIATLLAYHLTSNPKYADWHRQVHDWSYRHFPDREQGEWFGYLHRDGQLSVPLKGNLWKGPFHLPRMQLTYWKLLEEILRERSIVDSSGVD